MRFEAIESPMSKDNAAAGSHLPGLLAGLEDPWPSAPTPKRRIPQASTWRCGGFRTARIAQP